MNRRTGKIARLPFESRTEVNKRLRDGQTYEVISKWLADEGYGEFNAENLSNWKDGGHQDWLRDQERLESMRLRSEAAMELARNNQGSKLPEAAMLIAAQQISEVLEEFDTNRLKELLDEKPENFANLVNAVSRMTKEAREFEKYRDAVAERKAAIERTLTAAKKSGGLSAETIEEIESQLRLL